jgi:hypothetical protein
VVGAEGQSDGVKIEMGMTPGETLPGRLVWCPDGGPCSTGGPDNAPTTLPPPAPPSSSPDVGRLPSDRWGGFDGEGTVTAVQGLAPAAALEALAPEHEIGPTDPAAVGAWARGPSPRYGVVAVAGTYEGWTIIVDPGYNGTDPGRLAALSAAGRAVTIHDYTEGIRGAFYLADHGALVRAFDQEHYDGPYTTGPRLPQEAGLALGEVGDSWVGLRTLFTRLVGWDPFAGFRSIPKASFVAVGYRPG